MAKYLLTLALKSQDEDRVNILHNYLDSKKMIYRTKTKTSAIPQEPIVNENDEVYYPDPLQVKEVITVVEKKGDVTFLPKFAEAVMKATGFSQIGEIIINDNACKVFVNAEA